MVIIINGICLIFSLFLRKRTNIVNDKITITKSVIGKTIHSSLVQLNKSTYLN